MVHPQAVGVLLLAFVGLPILMVAVVTLATVLVRSRADAEQRGVGGLLGPLVGGIAWLGAPVLLVAGGWFHFDSIPPPGFLILLALAGLVTWLAFSKVGTALARHLPFAALIGAQAFRLPLELAMHHASELGVMPVQMSFEGANFDIATGASAAVLGLWLAYRDAPRWVIRAWNVIGALLLLTIVSVAVASTPPIAAFGPDRLNTFVTYWPFCWLPLVLVPAALLGHLLVARKLAAARRDGKTRLR